LKACPLVDELSLYDVVNTPGVTADLSHISSIAVRISIIQIETPLRESRKSPATFPPTMA
jgi:malate/lactate dehydrogenase